ncbi:MutS2 protein [Sclerotinia borealis F-4128]|uniref:MutS2 protein n=1 Tax=Sclerotinia borealis (strain F-4128) TaxID=1432307 RepID=W9CUF4_SCLBF|nr:MutS2 protein [Sclerotinia borealis F-4128]
MSFFHARNFRIYNNAIVPFPSIITGRITLFAADNHVICRLKPQVFYRGKKTKSSFNFNDLPHALDLRPLEPLVLEQAIIKDKSPERASLNFVEHVQDLLQEPEPVKAESQDWPNSTTPQDLEEDTKKSVSSRRARRTERLPQGLITLDSESSEVQESQAASSPSMDGKKAKRAKASDEVELLQGLLPLEPLEPLETEHEAPPYPTVIMQARSNMLKFENCVVVTRVGGFYELYFEHANEFGPLLGLKVAQKKTNAGPVSMAGFPFHQLDRYLKILVQDLSRYVAISEEFPNDISDKVKSGGLLHDRRVSRIVTPGTLIDEGFMDPLSNNYVLAIHVQHDVQTDTIEHERLHKPIGLAWLDLSTGHFFTQKSLLSELPSFMARIAPREIVLDEEIQPLKNHEIYTVLTDEHHIITYATLPEVRPISEWTPMLESAVSSSSVNTFTEEEISAGSCLLHYVETRLQSTNMKLQPPVRQLNVMGIDKNTMRALEIKKTIKEDNFSGSLLHTIRRTVTKGGGRLLENWLGEFALCAQFYFSINEIKKLTKTIASPSTSLDVLESRLDLVTHMLEDESLRARVTTLLKRSHDSHRLLQKFAFGRGDGDDLLDLASTIHATRDIAHTLKVQNATPEPCIQALLARIHLKDPIKLAQAVTDAIDEEGLVQQQRIEEGESEEMQALANAIVASEGTVEENSTLRKGNRKKPPNSIREYYNQENEAWIMKPTATPILKRLHKELSSLSDQKTSLAASLCDRLGATSLTLRFTPGLGHICHVKGRDINLNMPEARTISSSKTTRSLHHPEWSSLGQHIDQCRIHIRAEEQRLFYKLRELAITNLLKLRRNAAVLDEIDIACSFATLADERGWTRPILNTSSAHKIIGGRHPTVETGLEEEGRSFISNDCLVGDVHQAWLITGPNMAGKSTFLRQNALITVLAQVGSYVPAEYAELGIVDHIFSRVGSADNLYRDQSTFMVEMLESATILKNATSRSFVIMDEVGRGTTPTDGIAVAFACLHHLYHVNKCRTLFATHFHALVELIEENRMNAVGFYCTDVEEHGSTDEAFRYMYKLKEGINRHSHALKVAKLAGLPKEAIEVARQILEKDVNPK